MDENSCVYEVIQSAVTNSEKHLSVHLCARLPVFHEVATMPA